MYKKVQMMFASLIAIVFALSIFTLSGCDSKAANSDDIIDSSQIGDNYWPGDTWRSSTPEEQGMDSDMLNMMVKQIKTSGKDIHSYMIIRNGYVVSKASFYPYQEDIKHIINSCTKSVTSSLVGIAIGEKYIKSVNDSVMQYFPGQTFANTDEKKKSMTIKNVLTMTSGLNWTEDGSYGNERDSTSQMWRSKNQLNFVLNLPMREEPGKTFYYNTGSSHILSAIIQKTTGKNAYSYADQKLFKTLGISDVHWNKDYQGLNIGGAGIFIKPADMAKFGYLYLQKGRWNGKQVIPAEWVSEATKKQIDTPNGLAGQSGYGYQWWMNSFGGYAAKGYGGQYIYVLPDKNLVVVFTSGLYGYDFLFPDTLMETFILPSIKSPKPLAANQGSLQVLRNLEKEAEKKPESKPLPKLPQIAEKISGKEFLMNSPAYMKSIILTFTKENECTFELKGKDWSYKITAGLDDIYHVSDQGSAGPLPDKNMTAAKARFINESSFTISMKYLNDIDEVKYTLSFDGEKVGFKEFSKFAGSIGHFTGRLLN